MPDDPTRRRSADDRLARENRQRAIDNDPDYAATAIPWEDMSEDEYARAVSFWSTVSASHFGRSR